MGPDTVDLLGYIDLKAKVAEVAKANQMADRSVLMWARYRLGRHFGDVESRKLLLEAPAKFDTERFGPLGIGAIAGALNWQGKAGKVRKQASKLAETEGANAPQLQFVLADGFQSTKRPNLKKALPHLEKTLADDEPFLDAMLLWAKHDRDKWRTPDFTKVCSKLRVSRVTPIQSFALRRHCWTQNASRTSVRQLPVSIGKKKLRRLAAS